MQKTYTLIEFLEQNQDGYKLEDWEITWGDQNCWAPFSRSKDIFNFYVNLLFRKKVKTIVCNGFTIPAPETVAPKLDCTYFLANVGYREFFSELEWTGVSYDNGVLKRQILHLTKENAIMHAKAMLGIDPHKPD